MLFDDGNVFLSGTDITDNISIMNGNWKGLFSPGDTETLHVSPVMHTDWTCLCAWQGTRSVEQSPLSLPTPDTDLAAGHLLVTNLALSTTSLETSMAMEGDSARDPH